MAVLQNPTPRSIQVNKKHIHIVGCLPRSGTTLLTELMITCFDIDGHTDHEYSIFKEYTRPYNILCTKKPSDIKRVDYPLQINPDLYVIYMLRDPRDAISSRSHRNNSRDKKIWGNLQEWIRHQEIADKLSAIPRFITVRYEDLVTAPNNVQDELMSRLPFLWKQENFSEFHKIARPSDKSAAALGGARPISPSSIGNWRTQKPYIKAQIEQYGDISRTLIRLGYEQDTAWLDELTDVIADNSEEPTEKKSRLKEFWGKSFTQPRRRLLYRISCSRFGSDISRARHFLRQLTLLRK
jgi:hypothetical protein